MGLVSSLRDVSWINDYQGDGPEKVYGQNQRDSKALRLSTLRVKSVPSILLSNGVSLGMKESRKLVPKELISGTFLEKSIILLFVDLPFERSPCMILK